MFQPSPKWLPEERLKVVLAVALKLRNLASYGPPLGSVTHDLSERIVFIAYQPPEFLEANRAGILDGIPPEFLVE